MALEADLEVATMIITAVEVTEEAVVSAVATMIIMEAADTVEAVVSEAD